ncbi:MAG TPA: hypothetical protein H9761_00145 [Candidatus Eisenbergiella merdavium]|uniref:MORN repeat-containing protein n=1 Tax=Candidatus Eisenbergiella merdavium TaxID=2838551 RepID=A0A9D2NE73_9FIRM|nr:hypothetical protein [Candidatus Eisenbergiella merdavium]
MNEHKFNKKELAPIAALLIFIVIVLILCAFSAGRDVRAEQNGGTEQESITERESITEQESIAEREHTAGQKVSGQAETAASPESGARPASTAEGTEAGALNGAVTEVKETIELEEEVQAESIEPVLREDAPAMVSENGVSRNTVSVVKKTNVEMLTEMMDYWSKGNVEAVEDLSGLSHYRAMSAALQGPSYFYYCGERNEEGKPHGTGIAVYGGDQYYYGQWADGVRSGDGTWLKMYYYSDSDTEADRALISHSYTGLWQNNLPNGAGHEQYEIDAQKAKADSRYWQNVMGNFRDGLYDGRMYILTEDAGGNVQEWYGNATQGVFETFEGRDSEGRVPICQDAKNPDSHLWIKPLDNINLGLTEVRDQATAKSGN